MTKKADQENLQNVVFRMTPSEIARLDKLAEKGGLTRSHFIRNLIIVGLEETEIFDKFGLVRATITARDICSWMSMKVSHAISGPVEPEKPSS